jgi:hypothetical protein
MRIIRPLPIALVAFGALVFVFRAFAAEPPNTTFSPKPPGTIAQNQLVYLDGEAMHSQWRAVASKKLVGTASNTTFNQWYLSIYAIDGTTYKLKYQSPANGGPLSSVEKAKGADLWFPLQQLQIVGAAELMQPAVQQLVVQSHESAADCGAGFVTVLTVNGAGKVVPAVSVRNGCDLSATILHAIGGTVIKLTGPYYSASAAMCCPTKAHASAILRYRNGAWTETPKYYEFFAGKFAQN